MKSIFYYTLLLMLVIAGVANAQAPSQFNYQAVARDASGTPYANKTITVQIKILDGSSSGSQVYAEVHNNVVTNTYGLFNLTIGSKASGGFSLASVNWGVGSKYIEVSIDPAGGTNVVKIGDAQLLSVPYAIYSNTAGNALSGGSGGASSLIGGTGISISGNTISGLNTSNIWNAGQLQGRNVSTTGPSDGSLLVYQQSQGIWSPSLVGTSLIKGGGGTIVLGDFISGLTISSPAINFTTGTGISINNGVISNTLPDQVVTFVNSATTSITGTYPNFAIVSAPAQARTLSYTVATNTLSILGGNSVTIPLVSSVNDGLMSISQANTLQGLASLTGFDIKTSNPATLSVSRSGSVYTLSVPTTPGGTLNFDQTTSTLSISNGNSIVIPNANGSNAGLLSSSDFNALQNIKGVNVVSGSSNVSVSSLPGPVFSVSVTTPTAQTLTISGNNTLGLTGGASSSVTINDANGATSGLMSANSFNNLTTLSTLLGFDIQGVPGNTIVTRSGSLYTISVPSSVSPVYGTVGQSSTPAISIAGSGSVTGGNLTIDIADANGTNSGLLSSSNFNNLTTLSTLLGFDIQGVPGNTIVTRSGSLYTISVPSAITPTYGTIGSSATPALTISNGASVVGANLNIDIQDVNATNSGLMTSSDFLKLSTLSGVTINNGTGIAVTGAYPNFTITNTATGTFSQWTTTGSDIFFNGGNVGIGTSSPNAQLSVAGNTAISGNLTIAGLSGSGLRRVGVNNNGELIVVTTGAGLTTDLKSTTPALDIQNGKDAVVGTLPVTISIALATATSDGLLSASDFNKLQTITGASGGFSTLTGLGGSLTVDNSVISNPTIVVSTVSGTNAGVLLPADYSKLQSLQNVSVAGLGVTTTVGPNGLTYVIPASASNTTSIVGIGLIVTTLAGNTYQITNTYTSSGVGYFAASPGLTVSSTTGAIALDIASVSGFGILSTSEYAKLQGLQNISVGGLGVTTATGPSGLTYIIPAGGSGTVTTVTGVGPISVATGGTTPIITIATASGVNSGVILPADYTKLQALQNISVAGLGVTTAVGPNGLTYVIPASASNTTSIVGIGLTVTTLAGNTYQITNTFTSSGVGYFAASPGLTVSSTSGAIALDIASVNGFGILSSSEYAKLQGLQNVSVGGFGITTATGPNGLTYIIPAGGSGTVTTVTGVGPISVATGGTTPIITIATASGVNSGVILPADYTKLQNLQNISVSGIGVTTTTGPNGLTYVIPAGSSNTTSIVGIGLTVTTLAGNTYQITNTYTSAGVGYYAASPGLTVNSTTGSISLVVASVSGFGILSSSEYLKLQTLSGVSITAGNNISITTALGGLYTISGIATAGTFTTVTGTLPVSVNNTNPQQPIVSVNLATSTSAGLLSASDFSKLQTITGANGSFSTITGLGGSLTVDNTVISNPTIIVSTVSGTNAGVLLPTDYIKLQSLQNVSVAGFGVTTTTGPNGLTYVIPAAGSGTVTTVTGVGPISVATGGTTPIIAIATASGVNSGVMLPADYTKLQTLQNISVAGIGVTTTSGPNGLTYVIPAASSNTTSIVGIGLTVTTLSGNTYQITNTYTSAGIGYYSTSPGLSVSSTTGLIGLNLNQTSVVGTGVSLISTIGGFTTYSISGVAGTQTLSLVGNNLSISGGNFVTLPTSTTSIVGIGLSVATLGGNTFQITNTYTSSGIGYYSTSPGLSVSSTTGLIALNFNQTSVVGTNVSVSTLGGITTYSIGGINLAINPWSTTTGFIYSLNNTSISGISSIGGLNIRSISSVSGAYLSINANGVVGTIAGSTFVSQTLSLSGLNTLSISGGNSVLLPITTLVGSGIISVTNTATGLTTYTVAGISQWVSTTNGIYYPNYVGIGTLDPASALDLVANDAVNPGASIINFGGDGLYISSSGTGLNIDSEINGIYVTANTGYGISVQTNSVGSYGIQSTATSSGTAVWGIGNGASAVGIQGSIFSGSTGNSGYFDNQESTNPYSTVYINTASTVPGLQISSPANGIGIELVNGDLQIDNFSSFAGYTVTVDGNGVFHPAPYGGGSSQWIDDANGINYNAGNIAIGAASNSTNQFSIVNDNIPALSGSNLSIINYNNSPSFGASISLGHVLGSSSIPLTYNGGENLGEVAFDGFFGGSLYPVAGIKGTVPNKWNNISYNSGLEFYTTPVGSVTPVTAFSVGAASQLNLSSIVQPSGGNTKIGDIYSDGTSLYYYNGVWNDLLSGGSNQWTTLGGLIFANYGTSISGISTVGGFNIQNIAGVTGAVALGINPLTGEVGTIAGTSLVSTSVVGLGVTLITSPGLNTYSIAGISSTSQWTTSGTNILATYNTSISGISSVAGLNLRSISSVSGSYLGVNSSGVVGTIAGPAFSITSVLGFGITSSTVGNVTTYTINQTSVVGLNVSTTSGPNGFTTYSIGGLSSNFTTLTGLALASVTGGLGNYTITGLYPTLTLNGANLSVLGSGLPVVSLPLASVVGLNVSTVTGPTGFTTYSISGGNLTNPWSTATGFIYALNNTSISGISSVAGLNIRAITSVSGALLGINSNGAVGTIAGVASQWSPSLSTTPGIYYNAGNVGIGTSSPNKNAIIDISSSTQGALFPKMTTVQRTTFGLNLGLTDDGMLVYDTDLKSFINWYATPTSSGWSGGGNNNSNSSGNLAWIYNSTGTGLVTLNPLYSGVILSTTVAGTTLLTVNGGQLNTSAITTNGLNLSNLTGTGTRFVQADAAGNLSATTLSGFVQGANTTTATSLAFFTGLNSSVTGTNNLTWNNTSSTLGVNGNISLTTPNAGGAGGAVLVQMFTPVAIATGAIVIVDPTTDNQIVTSNQQGSTSAVGVIVGTCNASSYCNVAISGVVKVQSTTAIRGQHCITSTVAGFADSIPSPDPGSSIGVYISNASGGFANVLLK